MLWDWQTQGFGDQCVQFAFSKSHKHLFLVAGVKPQTSLKSVGLVEGSPIKIKILKLKKTKKKKKKSSWGGVSCFYKQAVGYYK